MIAKFLITWIGIAIVISAIALSLASFAFYVPYGIYILLGIAAVTTISLVAWEITTNG